MTKCQDSTRSLVVTITILATLTACSEPVAPPEVLSWDVVRALSDSIAEGIYHDIPYGYSLVYEALEAVSTDDSRIEALAAFRHARVECKAKAPPANILVSGAFFWRGCHERIEAVVATFGPGVVEETVARGQVGIDRWDDYFRHHDYRAMPEPFHQQRQAARTELAEALKEDSPVAGLKRALLGSALVLGPTVRYSAQGQLEHAQRALTRAIEAVGDAPTEAEAQALVDAQWFLSKAEESSSREEWSRAGQQAMLSWGFYSLDVIEGRVLDVITPTAQLK